MTPNPNYLSTYQLHQSYYSLFGEYDGAGGVEMREKERLKMGCISTPIPNHLSTHHPTFTTHLLMSGGVWRTHSKNKKTTQRSVEKVAMWSR